MDMIKLSPMQVLKKHRIGITNTKQDKKVVVEGFMKEVSEGVCAVCKKKLIKDKSKSTKDPV